MKLMMIVLSFVIAEGVIAGPAHESTETPTKAVHPSVLGPRMPSFTEPEMERKNRLHMNKANKAKRKHKPLRRNIRPA